jgi:MSHA biogenesis protein MshI
MFSIFRRNDRARGHIGLHRSDGGVAIAEVLAASSDGRAKLAHCSYEHAADGDALARAVKHLSNRKLPTVSVLPPSSYHMLLVEAPAVPDTELRAAVRWRIKDLIDFHVDDAVIDVFQMPPQGRGGPNQMMYAIAARSELVKGQVADLEEAGLELEVIDVLELCLRNVAALLEENGRGVAFLYLADSAGILLLIRQGILYLTRRIETGTETLRQANGLRSNLIAGLALETRRSLDYFESHYEQNAMPVLYTCGLDPADQDLLKEELGISVRNVHLASALDTELELDEETQRRCLPAIGAALRKDIPTL